MLDFAKIISVENLKLFLKKNKDIIKKTALPVIAVVAVLFFWLYGSEEPVTVENQTDNYNIQSEDSTDDNMISTELIFIDLGGKVNKPGVYEVEQGTRLFQVIDMAGGTTSDASTDTINLAEEVYDGQKIIVPGKEDVNNYNNMYMQQDFNDINSGKVNINTADSSTLQTIPGIGPAKASKIIEYRNQKGRFEKIEDIKNISGIGEKTFESLREYITV